jgi:hypothetical protein
VTLAGQGKRVHPEVDPSPLTLREPYGVSVVIDRRPLDGLPCDGLR